jgi:hypothetical protein
MDEPIWDATDGALAVFLELPESGIAVPAQKQSTFFVACERV